MADVNISATFPGEVFATALLGLLEKLLDGMSPEQKVQAWQQWFDFWAPVVKLMKPR